jgi:hypothetical protein
LEKQLRILVFLDFGALRFGLMHQLGNDGLSLGPVQDVLVKLLGYNAFEIFLNDTLRPTPLVGRIVELALSAAVFAIVHFAPKAPLTFQGKRDGPSCFVLSFQISLPGMSKSWSLP